MGCHRVADERSPTLRRRELARRLRHLRGDRTIQEVADSLGLTAPTISRIETGARLATRRNVVALCDLYGVDDALRARLLQLAREASQQGWWNEFDDLAIDPLIGLEIEAIRISSYESSVIPWIFQTKEYARAVIKGDLPLIESKILDERVDASITRQQILTRESAPQFLSLVDDSAINRVVGGVKVMSAQLLRMVELARIPNVTLQIVPFELGAHPGLNTTFTILEFMDPQPPVVYVESKAGGLYLERRSDFERFEEVMMRLRAGALDPDRSVRKIREAARNFGS